jgi:hypothetical protein
MKTLLLFSLSIFLFGCGHYSDGTSIWAEGAWILIALPVIGIIVFSTLGYLASKSGSKINPIYGGGEGGNVPFWQTGWPWFAVICAAWLIFTIVHQNLEK